MEPSEVVLSLPQEDMSSSVARRQVFCHKKICLCLSPRQSDGPGLSCRSRLTGPTVHDNPGEYSSNECWICCSSSANWDMWVSCRHAFCSSCSEEMMRRVMPCPLCRTISTVVVRKSAAPGQTSSEVANVPAATGEGIYVRAVPLQLQIPKVVKK